MSSDAVSVVVPVFNEAGAIPAMLPRLAKLLSRLPAGSEVILVDDGSTDGSGEQLATLPEGAIRLALHRRNRGYGAALKTGIAAARNEVVAIADADGTYPLGIIPRLAKMVSSGECDMAVGARSWSDLSLIRRPAKAALRLLAEHLTQCEIPDLNSGLRVFRRADALRLRALLPDRFSFTTTITMALLTEGAEVRFVPIRYASRVGSSKIRPIRDTVEFALLILRMTVAFNPLRVFAPVAGLLLALGGALLVARLLMPNPVGLATTVVCIVAGLQVLALGLLADLVNRRR